ncbi:MAG: hypothetical protein FGM54_11420, partial [Chitinophagaceae bacterium]|nr:hypothetical protein [Chitinophagaceae bacterium]
MKNQIFVNFRNLSSGLSGSLNCRKLMLVLAILFNAMLSEAQSANGRFLSYDFSPITSGTTVTTYRSYFANTTYIDSTGTVISRGTGLTANTGANGAWGFSALNAGTEAGAISGNDYVEFPVVPKAGFEVRLDSLILRWQFSATGIAVIHSVRTSTDGYS